MQLKFTFANHDNAANPIVLDLPGTATLASIRTVIYDRWPDSIAATKPDNSAGMRLFCMGRALDGATLAECALPTFDFPTPIHVAPKPSSRPRPKAGGEPTQGKFARSGLSLVDHDVHAICALFHPARSTQGGGGCCAIM
jgi:hypothetical protein